MKKIALVLLFFVAVMAGGTRSVLADGCCCQGQPPGTPGC